jgi:acylphosphatase
LTLAGAAATLADVIAQRSYVSGRVQGVFYRATTVRKAESLGLRGYARNLADGRVEVLAVGEDAAVKELMAWLWTGSAASKVAAVETAEVELEAVQNVAGFTSD